MRERSMQLDELAIFVVDADQPFSWPASLN